MSLNVLHGFPRFERLRERLDMVAAEIQRQDADIVLLQEVPWIAGLGGGARYISEQTGMNYLYLRANGNRWAILFEEGEAILSRYPMGDVTFTELEPQADRFQHRVVLGATADTPWGPLPVYVTHLTHSDTEINRRQAAALLRFVSELGKGPALVGGDLNAEAGDAQIESLSETWLDIDRVANAGLAGNTCCVSELTAYPAEALEKRIDYLFLVPGQGARVVSSQRVLDRPAQTASGWLWASDHAGLLAEIDLQR